MLLKITATLGSVDEYTRSVMILASTKDPVPTPVLVGDGDSAKVEIEQEALISWDLGRFLKNPVILWAHDGTCIPIGKASEVEDTPQGLRMRVTFAPAIVSPLAEQVYQGVKEDFIRTVSVGFVPGARTETIGANGERVVNMTKNELLEVSFVTVPADEDAGTSEVNASAAQTEEDQRDVISKAASALASHRARKRKAKAAAGNAEQRTDKADHVSRIDVAHFDAERGRLSRAKRTSFGGAVIPARVSRIGVLTYRLHDGTTRRELRHPDEVFKADSIATLEDVPVIDIEHHTAIRSPDDYRDVNVGHAKNYRHDAKFIESDLVIQDGPTLDAIDSGERTEISSGYTCRLDMTAGVYEGEPYDCVQRDIRYNHVALCPPNRGRAGPDVGLRLDNKAPSWGISHHEEENDMKIIRLDGKEYEVGSDAHLAKIDEMHNAAIAKFRADAKEAADKLVAEHTTALAAEKKRADEAQGRADALDADLKKFRADADAAKAKADQDAEEEKKEGERKRKARRSLERIIARFFASDDEEEDDDGKGGKGEKMDAKLDAMSDRELMVFAIKKAVPSFDDKEKSDDYVRARFDTVVETVKSERGVDGVVRTAIKAAEHLDANDGDDAIAKARKKRDEQAANAWKTTTQNGGAR